jgi:predicted secreted Zn-dependent protease
VKKIRGGKKGLNVKKDEDAKKIRDVKKRRLDVKTDEDVKKRRNHP